MAEAHPQDRPRSRNPLRQMMQHLTVEPPTDDSDGASSPRASSTSPRRDIMRRLSWRKSRSPSAHSDVSAPASPSTSLPNPDPDLCPQCASLAVDLEATLHEADAAFTKPPPAAVDDGSEYLLARVQDLARHEPSCPLCRLFRAVRVRLDATDAANDFGLSAFSSRDTNYLLDPVKLLQSRHPVINSAPGLAPGFLGVVPRHTDAFSSECFRQSGMLFRTLPHDSSAPSPPARGRSPVGRHPPPETPALALNDDAISASGGPRGVWGREIGPMADMDVASNWLSFCRSHHDGRCSHRRPPSTELPAFHLIDCSQSPLKVVAASLLHSDDYVALSYVRSRQTAEPWPLVVRDAAAVARALGLRFLWVDLLCLDSPSLSISPEQRAEQIARMDDIFEGAALVIIAANGHDTTGRLSGVSQPRVESQPRYRLPRSGTMLVSSMRDPRLSIQQSAWATRGWTYQEALLARRRLVFTGQQMYWECDGMACPESLILPLELWHDASQRRMADFVRPGLFNAVSYVGGSWEGWKPLGGSTEAPSTLSVFRAIDQHVANFTRRHLSKGDDSLSAMLGLLRQIERTIGRGRLGHLVGIPLWVQQPPAADGAVNATTSRPRRLQAPWRRTRHLFALSTSFWHHVRNADGHEPQRRPHLPSWTWAGWSSPVDFFSSIVIADPEGVAKERKQLNHHYVNATQLARGDASSSPSWIYSPEMLVQDSAGRVVFDFADTNAADPRYHEFLEQGPQSLSHLPQDGYRLCVSDPLVLDRVKARTLAGGSCWLFNDVSVSVNLSLGGRGGIREYIEKHARGQQMTVLWFVEDATIMLLVVQRAASGTHWERVGRARMAFVQEPRDVVRRFEQLEDMLRHLPLRRLGQEIVIE
ncbi:hypothetical protein CDD82_7306 [Ophiocordyceps australis]|uniref:Heterokaryon incompatibility domain-containing protein n=1 Tax=Ophiocordyceps australis TaxID=1399860 RepID=A0A2C5YMY9_9HYPO|nr:hypothetical protein CDD82_7306 [Ophiocordyceps australis]